MALPTTFSTTTVLAASAAPAFHTAHGDEAKGQVSVRLVDPLACSGQVYVTGTPYEIASLARKLLAVAEEADTNPIPGTVLS